MAHIVLTTKNKYEPDYNKIMVKVNRLMAIAGVTKESCYEWCSPDCRFKITPQDYWAVLPW